MLKSSYPTLNEEVYFEQLPNGLSIYLLPKPGFAKTYAMFTTRYGSIDNRFNVEGQPPIAVVDGIAHFLEHKLFEEEDGDVFMRFASQGASANAFTTHTRTSYLFSATDQIEANLETLLDFVQRPYLTPENVEKEKGIIEQEIRMYDDQAFWRAYRGLLENLYHRHPARIDIAGTVESIRRIDVAALMACYRTFYHPSNMVLVVVGDIDPERIMALVRDNQAAKNLPPQPPIERHFDPEPATVGAPQCEVSLAITKPMCLIGFKDTAAGLAGAELVTREMTTRILMDAILGKSSPLYRELDDAGLIDPSYRYDYEASPSFSFAYLGGETDDPETLVARVQAGLERARREGLPEAAFVRARHRKIGEFLRVFNSPEALSYEFTQYLFHQADLYRLPTLLEAIDVADGQRRLQELFVPERMTVSLVRPLRREA